MLGGIGVQELLLIFLVALLLFGSNKIPEIARSLGKGITEFKKAMDATKNEISRSIEEAPPPRNAPERPVATKPGVLDSVPGNSSPNILPPPQDPLPPA
jgi:sec-independent protein translocase protein TatA